MSKTCNNCGNIMEDDANICSRCGTQYVALQGVQQDQTANNAGGYQQPYQQPVYQQPYGQGYQQPYVSPVDAPMSVGSWVGTILLTSCLGIISLILLFVWAFGSDVNIAKKNYCRAMLIVELIAVGVVILLFILFAIMGVSIFQGLADGFSYSYNW